MSKLWKPCTLQNWPFKKKNEATNIMSRLLLEIAFRNQNSLEQNSFKSCWKYISLFFCWYFFPEVSSHKVLYPTLCYRNLWNLITFTVTKKGLWTFAFGQKCLFHCLCYSFFSTPVPLNFSAAQSYHRCTGTRNCTPEMQTTSWRKRRRQRYTSRYFGHPLCH